MLRLEKAPSLVPQAATRPLRDARRRVARPVGVLSLAGVILVATLVGLPEALGDRPYDPQPISLAKRVLEVERLWDVHSMRASA